MRVARPALCLALAASLTAAGAASAASRPKPKPVKPVCNIVTDVKDDAELLPGLAESSMDIVSADLASNAKMVTAVVRVNDLAAASATTLLGRTFYLRFTAPGGELPIFLSYTKDLTGESFSWGTLDGSLYSQVGDAQGIVDTVRNEVRLSVATSVLSDVGTVKPGSKFTDIYVETDALIGAPMLGGLLQRVDEATGSKPYIAGAPSCVIPGK